MKKLIFILYFGCLAQGMAYCQSSYQSELLRNFFLGRGKEVLANWAHPLYSYYSNSTTIEIGSNCVYVTNQYKGNFVDFNCTYKVSVSYGVFTDLQVTNEGNAWTSCFYVCDEAKESLVSAYETDSQTQKRVETNLGKTINYFTCKDYCLLGLNYYWSYDGYYSKY